MSTAAAESHLRENPFGLAKAQLRRVGEVFALDPNLIRVLSACKKAVEVSIPVSMDDGSIEVLPGLSHHPQHRARPLEGRHSLPPRRHARRGQVARDVDDVEVRADGSAVRRREGRCRVQPEGAERRRARAAHPSLHERDHQRHRAGARHPCPRRRDGRPRDGVDLRHLLDEQGALRARRRDRQASVGRRLARAGGGDRARRPLLHPGALGQRGPPYERVLGRGAGIRERRREPRAPAPPGGSDGRRRLGLGRRRLQRSWPRHPVRGGAQAGARHARRARQC